MHLNGKLGAGFYCNALDLIAIAVVDGVIYAPGAVDFPVVHVLVSAIVLDGFHDFLHVLNLVLVGNQQGILGFDDYQVFHAHGRHQAVVCPHQSAFSVVGDHVAGETVAIGVFVTHFPQGRPGADITPACIQRDHGGVVGFFHDGVVDGVFRAFGEDTLVHTGEVQVFTGIVQRSLADG